jgi:O-antigen ligase
MSDMTLHETQFRWRSAPLRIALSPLAGLLAAVHAAVRRPSFVVALAVVLVGLPSNLQNVAAKVTVADLAGIAAAGAVALRMLGGDRAENRRGWLPYAALLFSLAVATVTATDVSESLLGFLRYTELFILVPVAVAMTIRDRTDLKLVAGAIVGTTAVEGAVGVYQYLTNTGASYAGQYIRAIGTFGADQALALGAVLGYGLVATLALGLASRGRARIALVATAAVTAVPLGLTLSRGAWIATAAAVLVVLFVFSWRAFAAVLASGALALCLLTLVAPGKFMADERVTSIASSGSEPDRSVRDRYALWGTAVDIWADNPVTGIGLKDFAQYRDSYAPLSLSAGSDVDDPTGGFHREPLLSAHNQYLDVLAEQGLVGILAFGALLGTLTAAAFRRRRATDDSATGDSATDGGTDRFLGLLGAGVMVWTLIDFLYGDIGAGPTGILLAVLLGLVARRGVIVPKGASS